MNLRPMQPSDGPALVRLMEDDPPHAGMNMTTRFQVDAWQAWTTLKPDMVGVVAENDAGEIVGAATVSFDEVMFEGERLPGAYLENLKVHHTQRGKGLGTQLAQWRIEQARERFGANGVIMTGTSTDNTASINTMKKWCKQFFSPMQLTVRPPLTRSPAPHAGVTVRNPEPHEYAQIVEKANRFYAGYNLYTPLEPGAVQDYQIAVAENGVIVAGVMLSNRGRLMVDEISNLPTPLKVMNTFLHIVPADGRMRTLEASNLWFTELAAARYLWQCVRYQYQEGSVSYSFDPRSPLKDVFQIKPWHLPRITLIFAIHGPREMDVNKLVAAGARG